MFLTLLLTTNSKKCFISKKSILQGKPHKAAILAIQFQSFHNTKLLYLQKIRQLVTIPKIHGWEAKIYTLF